MKIFKSCNFNSAVLNYTSNKINQLATPKFLKNQKSNVKFAFKRRNPTTIQNNKGNIKILIWIRGFSEHSYNNEVLTSSVPSGVFLCPCGFHSRHCHFTSPPLSKCDQFSFHFAMTGFSYVRSIGSASLFMQPYLCHTMEQTFM